MSLQPCASCQRHIESHEVVCPFCGGAARNKPEQLAPPPIEFRSAPMYGGPPIATGTSKLKMAVIVTVIVAAAIVGAVTAVILRR